MIAFALVASSVIGIVTYLQTDDVGRALLWFMWGLLLTIACLLADIREDIRKRRKS